MKEDLKDLLHTFPAYKKTAEFVTKYKKITISAVALVFCLGTAGVISTLSEETTEISKVPESLETYEKEDSNATEFSKLYDGLDVEEINFLQSENEKE